MFYGDRILLLSLLLSHINLMPADKPNADVIASQSGGKIVSSGPGTGGSVSHTPSNSGGFMLIRDGQLPPSSPTPSQPRRNGPPRGVTGGLLGFLYNVGKASEKDRRHADTEAALRKAERDSMYGNAGLIVAGNPEKGLLPPGKSPFEQDIPLSPAEAKRLADIESERYKREAIQQAEYNQLVERNRAAVAAEKAQTLSLVKPQSEPTILPESPLKGLIDEDSGNGRGGISSKTLGMGVGAALVSKLAAPVTAPVLIPVAGGTAGAAGVAAGGTAGTVIAGGTVAGTGTAGTLATTTTSGWLLGAAAPVVVVAGAGIVLGTAIAMAHDGIFNPGIGWFPNNEQRKAYHANRAALKAGKTPSSIPQYKPSSNTPTPPGNPTPNPNRKKPDDDKDKNGAAKKSRNEMIAETRSLTNKEARNLVAEKLPGYIEKKPPFETHGNNAFYNQKTKTWISADQDCHNGGVWKMLDRSGNKRLGTFDASLTKRIKD